MTRPQGDPLVFEPAEEATNLLFQELEMVQPAFYSGESSSVQSVLSQEVIDLQKILDFASTEVNLMDQQFTGLEPATRGRNSSICSNGQPTGSPESGISGCDATDLALSPHFGDPTSPPEYVDPVQMSMREANIFDSRTAMNGLTNLLQLQEELMTHTDVEESSPQRSPLYKDTNPLLGQTRSSQFTSSAPAPRFLAPPYGLPRPGTAAAHTAVSPSSTAVSPSSTATSVIVHASNQPNFSLPGSISLLGNQVETLKAGESDKSSLPVVVAELETNKEDEIESLKSVVAKQERGPDGKYICYVCGEKAGKHSYYGGQVCASCRAFFRRSVQSKYYEIFECKKDKSCLVNAQTRKNCQFCRFKKCLESGMKTSWVLSDEERNRRFNKFNKINMKSVNSDKPQTIKKAPPSRLSELYMAFTLEEQQVLEKIQNTFKGQYCNDTWLQKLLLLNREAGINLIESAYKVKPIKYETWTWLVQSWSMAFSQNILPHFTAGHNIPSREFSQLINGTNLYVAHTFKTSLCVNISSIKKESDDVSRGVADNAGKGGCPMSRQVKELAANKYEDSELSRMLDNLNLQESTPSMPAYDDLYPPHWANNEQLERRHLELMLKIKKWPMNENEFDCNLVLMMMLILFFDTHANSLAKSENVGKIQLKYSLLLQRYLKSRMVVERANKKFLEAMLLLSETRELWEMNQLHSRM